MAALACSDGPLPRVPLTDIAPILLASPRHVTQQPRLGEPVVKRTNEAYAPVPWLSHKANAAEPVGTYAPARPRRPRPRSPSCPGEPCSGRDRSPDV